MWIAPRPGQQPFPAQASAQPGMVCDFEYYFRSFLVYNAEIRENSTFFYCKTPENATQMLTSQRGSIVGRNFTVRFRACAAAMMVVSSASLGEEELA